MSDTLTPTLPPVEELRAGTIDARPVHYDWTEHEHRSRSAEAFTFTAAIECETCGAVVDSTDTREECHRLTPDDGETWYTDDEAAAIEDALDEFEPWTFERCADVNATEERLWDAGPMMNFYYPCPLDDEVAAARAIEGLPLVVVSIEDADDGETVTGFALTGGGMDLSWEIAAAYVACGFLPPVHFADLPRMAGRMRTAQNLRTIDAMREACAIAHRRAFHRVNRVDELGRWLSTEAGA